MNIWHLRRVSPLDLSSKFALPLSKIVALAKRPTQDFIDAVQNVADGRKPMPFEAGTSRMARHAIAYRNRRPTSPKPTSDDMKAIGLILDKEFRRWTDDSFRATSPHTGKTTFLRMSTYDRLAANGWVTFHKYRKCVALTRKGRLVFDREESRVIIDGRETRLTPTSFLLSIRHRPVRLLSADVEIKPHLVEVLEGLIRNGHVHHNTGAHTYAITDTGVHWLEAELHRLGQDMTRRRQAAIDNHRQWLDLLRPERPRGEPPKNWRKHFPMPERSAPGALSRPEFDTLLSRNAICADPLTGCYIVLQRATT